MTTRTYHPRPAPHSLCMVHEVSSEQGTTYVWSLSEDDARYTTWMHDLLPGMPALDDLAVQVVYQDRCADWPACVAVADRHVECLYARHDQRPNG